MATRQEWRRYMRSTDVHQPRKADEREAAQAERDAVANQPPKIDTKGRRILEALS